MFTGRVVTAGEPVWTDEDTELALAWQTEKNLRCGMCGHHLDESADPVNLRRYVAQEITCNACAVTEWRRKALADQDTDMAGKHVYAVRIDHQGGTDG